MIVIKIFIVRVDICLSWTFSFEFSNHLQICRFLPELLAGAGFQAIKTRFLRFYPKPTAFEAIEPNIAALFRVSALRSDQGAIACPKWSTGSNFRQRKLVVADTMRLDTISIVPRTLSIAGVPDSEYHLDFIKATLTGGRNLPLTVCCLLTGCFRLN